MTRDGALNSGPAPAGNKLEGLGGTGPGAALSDAGPAVDSDRELRLRAVLT